MTFFERLVISRLCYWGMLRRVGELERDWTTSLDEPLSPVIVVVDLISEGLKHVEDLTARVQVGVLRV